MPALVAGQPESSPAPPQEPRLSPLRMLQQKAVARLAQMGTYQLRLKRRELIGGHSRPEEIILCKFRKEPFSVYMKWVGAEAKGREVIYVKGKYESKIHMRVAAGDVPLVAAGKHVSFAVDSVFVKSSSRYSITEAGLHVLVERLGQLLDANEKGDTRHGTLKHLGLIKRPEFDTKLDAVLHTIPARSEPLLPGGGQRLLCFEPTLGLPVLIVTQDDAGREVEYYCHDRFMIPGNFDDSDFNPDLWDKAKPPPKK